MLKEDAWVHLEWEERQHGEKEIYSDRHRPVTRTRRLPVYPECIGRARAEYPDDLLP